MKTQSTEYEKGLKYAKLIGFLFILSGITLILTGIKQFLEMPQLSEVPGFDKLAGYLGSVGVLLLIVYGILAIALGIGLIKEEEWAAGGSFVFLILTMLSIGSNIWYLSSIGAASLFLLISSVLFIIFGIVILAYLVWASGWK